MSHEKNVCYFLLLSLTVCCSFDLDLTINITGSAEKTSCLPQKDSLSTIIAVPKDIDHSEESHRRDRDWEILTGS
ncbi:hypothetical protein [Flavobacterium hydrophilum]|uniref:Uncharacterized protein n=1 Tax=Flavobacterium hydrophilum TaxID=2211445 RepID=A0A2V4C605_9FLAO|nr:hypothetical protein [Flavobacterium hydrophilum]PXY46417.1 hypothetical protein DMB68_04350 [Flavobacterium hydrophilum]